MEEYTVKPIAHMHSDFHSKFGIPRQAGIVAQLEGTVVFTPEYRDPQALRGLEGFSHIWLLWRFSQSEREGWAPTVRPPRLGGNVRMGVFATRSPFRPNSIGLSCVRLLAIEQDEKLGHILRVSGGDLMDGTPILDIKPYVPYADSHPEAAAGFAPDPGEKLRVHFEPEALSAIPEVKLEALQGVLENDPRPRYQREPERVYAMEFAGLEIKFEVSENELRVISVHKL